MRSWTRRAAGLLVVMVMTATPMVVAACAAFCLTPERQACHESAAFAKGPASAGAASAAGRQQFSKSVPHASPAHSCCADAQALVSSAPPALPADDHEGLVCLAVHASSTHAERTVDPSAPSPPVIVPPGPFSSPLNLRV
jgi:hypothetical protein